MPDVIFSRYSLCQLKKIKYIFIFCKVLDMGGNVLTCVHASKAEIRKHEKRRKKKKLILHTLTRWVWVQGIELSSKADGWGDCFQCLLGKWLKCTAHVNKRSQWGKCEQRLAADSSWIDIRDLFVLSKLWFTFHNYKSAPAVYSVMFWSKCGSGRPINNLKSLKWWKLGSWAGLSTRTNL